MLLAVASACCMAVALHRPAAAAGLERPAASAVTRGGFIRTAVAAAASSLLVGRLPPSHAATAEVAAEPIGKTVAEIPASGLIFKDVIKVQRFSDPKVQGVQLYLSDFQRPVTEKLAKGDIFSDPSSGGLTCSHKGA